MPIEIRELIIKINLVGDDNSKHKMDSKSLLELKKQIVKECTDKVIYKLRKKSER